MPITVRRCRRPPLRRAAARADRRTPSRDVAGRTPTLILLAGDLTTHGEPEQAAVARGRLPRRSTMPVYAVLGNHDYHADRVRRADRAMLEEAGIIVLERARARHRVRRDRARHRRLQGVRRRLPGRRAARLRRAAPARGLRRRRGDEVAALEAGLEAISGCHRRIVLLHYAPIAEHARRRAGAIWAFLGSRPARRPDRRAPARPRPARPCPSRAPSRPIGPVPVRNVAVHVIGKDFELFEL